jgi:hypothetical protein
LAFGLLLVLVIILSFVFGPLVFCLSSFHFFLYARHQQGLTAGADRTSSTVCCVLMIHLFTIEDGR